MPRAKRRLPKSADVKLITRIIGELDSLLEAFDDEDPEDIEYRLDALTTVFLKAQLVSGRRLGSLKFHVVIEELSLDVPDRDVLAEEMETFQDLINAYGDEPSEEELEEARGILEKVVKALQSAFQNELNKNQLRLDLRQ